MAPVHPVPVLSCERLVISSTRRKTGQNCKCYRWLPYCACPIIYERLVISTHQTKDLAELKLLSVLPYTLYLLYYMNVSHQHPSDKRLGRTASATDGSHTPCTCSVINMNVSHKLHQTRDWAELPVRQIWLSFQFSSVHGSDRKKPI